MIVCARPPSPPLRPFVENLWYHEDVTTEHAMERLLPDGAIELIVDLTEPAKRWLDPTASAVPRTVRSGWVSGQHSRHIHIEAAKASCMVGVRFRPGGAFPFFDFPIRELNEEVVELEHVWGFLFRELRERLLAAGSAESRWSLLEAALMERSPQRLEVDPLLQSALEGICTTPIRALASELGVTQKRLVRSFTDRVGLRPKALARILRFQKVLNRVETDERSRVRWSFIAQDAGYYDQAHFIRDFEALSGLSPSRYLREKGEYVNFVPLR